MYAPTIMLAAVALLLPGSATPGPGASRTAEHPEVDSLISCIDCHSEATPEMITEYTGSLHGMNTVPCVVCHGALGSTFVSSPPAERCRGCHAEQVDTAQRTLPADRQACSSCHPMHSLTPHRM